MVTFPNDDSSCRAAPGKYVGSAKNCQRPKRCRGGQRALTCDVVSCGALKRSARIKRLAELYRVSGKLYRVVQCQENYTGRGSGRKIIQGAVPGGLFRVV